MATAHRQVRRVGDLRHGQPRAQRERVPAGHDRDLALRHQLLGVELAVHVVGMMHQRDVCEAPTEHLPLLTDLAEHHLHGECAGLVGVGLEQAAQNLERGAGLGHQHQPVALGHPSDPSYGGPRRLEEVASLFQQHLPGLGHLHAATIAQEQLDAQTSLESLDRAGQRRLAHA